MRHGPTVGASQTGRATVQVAESNRPDFSTVSEQRIASIVDEAYEILVEFESIIERDAQDHGIDSLPDWQSRIGR